MVIVSGNLPFLTIYLFFFSQIYLCFCEFWTCSLSTTICYINGHIKVNVLFCCYLRPLAAYKGASGHFQYFNTPRDQEALLGQWQSTLELIKLFPKSSFGTLDLNKHVLLYPPKTWHFNIFHLGKQHSPTSLNQCDEFDAKISFVWRPCITLLLAHPHYSPPPPPNLCLFSLFHSPV